MKTQTFECHCAATTSRKVLATVIAVLVAFCALGVFVLLRQWDVTQKNAGFSLWLGALTAFILAFILVQPARGTLTLTQNTLTLESRDRVRHFSLQGATQSYAKWLQPYVGVKGSVLYLTTLDSTIAIGGETFVFRHPGSYREPLAAACDVWLKGDAFVQLHTAISARLAALAPPPRAPEEPIVHGYREPGYVQEAPVPARAVAPWLEVELEPNPSGPEMQSSYFLRGIALAGGFLGLYGAAMSLFIGVHEHALSAETAVAIAIAGGAIVLVATALFALRKTYRTQLFIERGVLRIARGPKQLDAAPLATMRVEPTLWVSTVKGTTYRQSTLQLHFPSGRTFSLGAHFVDLADHTRKSGPPAYLVGAVEWPSLLEGLGLRPPRSI